MNKSTLLNANKDNNKNHSESDDIKFDSISEALTAIKNGECIVVVDDETRENEGDLICAAQFATPQQINFMATEGRGLICLAMQGTKLDDLDLPLMVDRNTDENETAFTVSIDAGPEFGVSTGISADDRAQTIQIAINQNSKPEDLRRPGHIFPLRAKDGGVLKRAGHTEAAVDLSILAGLNPSGVICEIQNSDGSMARLPELQLYAKQWGLKIISIADLIRYRFDNERFVHRESEADLPSIFGNFKAIGYRNKLDGTEHIALVKKSITPLKEPVLVRMHSECLTGDAFGSLRCDCRPQLQAALARIEEEGEGVVVYLRQEGRGIGLINKIKAYSLQDGGLDTVEANEKLGFAPDLRNYGVGAQILTDLGIRRLKLLTNNPRKIAGLGGYGIKVEKRVPLVICPSDYNSAYLNVKRDKLGHLFEENYKSNQISAPFIALFWDGNLSNDEVVNLKQKVSQYSIENNIKLNPLASNRLYALWDSPNFVWEVKIDNQDNNFLNDEFYLNLTKIIEYLGSSKEFNRCGLIVTKSKDQAIHPSNKIELINWNFSELQYSLPRAIKKFEIDKISFSIIYK
tara:strand:- start:9509 stop:11230 length:1722 start_codon:yes stop_codon:yes gene_type:complete